MRAGRGGGRAAVGRRRRHSWPASARPLRRIKSRAQRGRPQTARGGEQARRRRRCRPRPCQLPLPRRIDPELAAPRDYGSEAKRAAFLSALGSQLYTRTRLRADLRRLYRAGGSAAKELTALATALAEAGSPAGASAGAAPNHVAALQQAAGSQTNRGAAALAANVAAAGQQLLGALGRAPALTHQLDSALAAGADLGRLRGEVAGALEAKRQRLAALQAAVAELEQEQQSLEGGWGGMGAGRGRAGRCRRCEAGGPGRRGWGTGSRELGRRSAAACKCASLLKGQCSSQGAPPSALTLLPLCPWACSQG